MSMKSDLTKETAVENDDDYEKVVEEVEDEKYGRKRFIVRKVKKQKAEDYGDDGTGTIQDTMYFQKRTEDLGLDKGVGSRMNVIKDSHKSEHGGYFCQLCDTHVWDSNAWLDHLNGKKHARLLGMNNKVEKVGIQDIKEKLKSLKQSKLQKSTAYELLKEDIDGTHDMVNKRIRQEQYENNLQKKLKKENEEEKLKTSEESNKEKVKNQDKNKNEGDNNNGESNKTQEENEEQEENDEEEEEDPSAAIMAMMGLPTTFKSKK